MKPEVTHPTISFFVKHKEDLAGGTTVAITDTGAPEEVGAGTAEELGIGGAEELSTKELNTGASEEAGAGASEELVPDVRLLQKDQD